MDIFLHPRFHPYFEKYPLRFIDIGASGGIPKHWRRAQRFLYTIAFEPDPREFERIKRQPESRVTYLNAALYREKANVDFYLTRKQEVSSLLLPNRKVVDQFREAQRFDVTGQMTISTNTLDEALKQAKISHIDFIKLDTQGSELMIFEGAQETLAHVFGLEVEAEFIELYKGQSLFSELEQFLRAHGFQFFDLRPHYWKRTRGARYGHEKGQLIFADTLFLKNTDKYWQWCLAHTDQNEAKAHLLHGLATSLLYGYADYAFELYELARDMFTSEEQDLLYKVFRSMIPWSSRFPNIKGRSRLAAILHRLAYRMEPRGLEKTKVDLGNF